MCLESHLDNILLLLFLKLPKNVIANVATFVKKHICANNLSTRILEKDMYLESNNN